MVFTGCGGGNSGSSGRPAPPPPSASFQVTVNVSGSGTVTSSPAGIDCGQTCSATFSNGTAVSFTASPAPGSSFGGWSGACSGTNSCSLTVTASTTLGATFAGSGSLQSINHIVFMVQENRSFDHYFGALREYWAQNGFPDQPFDGLPQFNIPAGPPAFNPGCDPAFPFVTSPAPFNDCVIDANSPPVNSYHLITQCVENPSPSWNESHVDWNVANPLSSTPTLDGFVHTAGKEIRDLMYVPGQNTPESDVNGLRVMGYYDSTELPYYYFMASNFATSDRWFMPIMTRTPANRMYLMAATSAGRVYPPAPGSPRMSNKTIFEELNSAGISWRVYVTDDQDVPLMNGSELSGYNFAIAHPDHFVSATQFLTDAQNGTLPAVSEIDPGFVKGLDEHAEQDDSHPGGRIQVGAQYVSTLINGLMQSPSWKDTVFILTWDESGGFYDHVPPQPTVSPDGIAPSVNIDLKPGDICTTGTGLTCDFVVTGYRVPLIVISPFTKKNFVSHTVSDYTAILKFIETRFGVPNLTSRDAAQMDMTEFFDFKNPPWMIPPGNVPVQPTSAPCYMDHLP